MAMLIPKTPRPLLGVPTLPFVLGGGYDASAQMVRDAYNAGVCAFFWNPLCHGMTVGLRHIGATSPRGSFLVLGATPFTRPRLNTLYLRFCSSWLGLKTLDVLVAPWARDSRLLSTETAQWVRRAKEEGRIRAFGVATHCHQFAAAALASAHVDILFVRYNAAHRHHDQMFAGRASSRAADRKPVVTYTSTKWQYLIRRDPAWPNDQPIPTAADCYAFALSNPGVDAVMIGPSRPVELEDAMEVFEIDRSAWDERAAILGAYGAFIYEQYGRGGSYTPPARKWWIVPR